MTYLVENRTAALVIPPASPRRCHPTTARVMQLPRGAGGRRGAARRGVHLARAAPSRGVGALDGGRRASLKTLVDEPDFATASFPALGAGRGPSSRSSPSSARRGPDPVTREVARWSGRDEARHVAFGMAHLGRHVERDPTVRGRLAAAVARRHDALRHRGAQRGGVRRAGAARGGRLVAGRWAQATTRCSRSSGRWTSTARSVCGGWASTRATRRRSRRSTRATSCSGGEALGDDALDGVAVDGLGEEGVGHARAEGRRPVGEGAARHEHDRVRHARVGAAEGVVRRPCR